MKSALLQRWLASIATVALLLVVSAFLAHQHAAIQKASGADHSCELCLQLTTAVAPPAGLAPPDLVLRAWKLLPADTGSAPSLAPPHAYHSRAPPRV